MIERRIVISRLDPFAWLGITKPSQCLLILELEADLHLDLKVCNFVALHVPSDIAHLHPVDLTQISGGAFDAGPHRLGDWVATRSTPSVEERGELGCRPYWSL